jgi:hypothetical protein
MNNPIWYINNEEELNMAKGFCWCHWLTRTYSGNVVRYSPNMKTNNVHFQFVFEGFFIAGSSELLNLKSNDNNLCK